MPLSPNSQGTPRLFLLFLYALFALGLSACQPVESDSANNFREPASGGEGIVDEDIVNGRSVTGREPWARHIAGLAILKDGSYVIFCTASILNNRNVVTAAHCIGPKISDAYVVFGLGAKSGVHARKVVRATVHENYRPDFGSVDIHDLALVRFQGGLPTGYRAAAVLKDPMQLAYGSAVLLAGYGVTNGRRQTGSGVLRYTSVKIQDPAFGQTEVATDEALSGSCNGDSGGPAIIHVAGRFLLWGVTSRGDSDCRQRGIYTRLDPFADWIRRNL